MSTITVTKDFHGGWKAEDTIPFEPEGHALRIVTLKSGKGGVASMVTRVKVESPTPGHHSFVMFEDYNEAHNRSPGVKATSKAIADVHGKTLAQIDSIKAQVREFYAAKAKS